MVLKSLFTVARTNQTFWRWPPGRWLKILRAPLLVALLALAACATKPPSSSEMTSQQKLEISRVNDPWEPTNRKFFAIGMALDRNIVQPLARGYRKTFDPELRTAIRNSVRNLREPVTFTNDLLQADFGKASVSLGRLIINSTVGIGGLFDPAQELGLPRHREDFGQTLAIWGVGEGPYLFVPVLGPYPPRDLAGFAIDIVMNPLFWVDTNWSKGLLAGRFVMDNIDARERQLETVQQLEETSLDYYAAVRNLYRQTRNFAIRDGQPEFENLPDFDEFE